MSQANWYTGHESSKKARYIHSININGYNTWDDWFLIPSSRPVINPPPKKRSTWDVIGGDGIIDESESLRNFPTYSTRTGQWTFYVDNDHGNWQSRYSDIMDAIHGIQCTITLDDDPSWYYTGTISVNEWQSNKDRSTIVLDYELYPYKMSYISSTDENWKWDPFNFETDIIYSKPGNGLNQLQINTTLGVEYRGFRFTNGYFGRKPVSPKIIVTDSTNGIYVSLSNPELNIHRSDFYHYENDQKKEGVLVQNTTGIKVANFTLSSIHYSNNNDIYLSGVGTITFDFRVGGL